MEERGALTADDGRKLTYRRFGEGPPLVGVPGGPGMAAGYMTDLAGLGHFPFLEAPETFRGVVRDFLERF